MEEPSVLDWVKEKLTFWRYRKPEERISIPPAEEGMDIEEMLEDVVRIEVAPAEVDERLIREGGKRREAYRLPWSALLAVMLGLAGQRMLAPETRSLGLGLAFYGMAVILLIWGWLRKEWQLPELPDDEENTTRPCKLRWSLLLITVGLLVLAFLLLGGNRFNIINLVLWLLSVVYVVLIVADTQRSLNFRQWIQRWQARIRFPWKFQINGFAFLFILALIVSVFFRVYQLNQVPAEMISDHAEKLLDIGDVLNGELAIFFIRNTGREAFQFYWTALVSLVFGTGLSFLSLKIGTTLAGLFTLPFIYLLGKEMGSKWGGLAGMFLGGIAYWPNVITRIGLRFTFYAAFTAPALYFFMRGLRKSSRNDIIWAGIFLGIGLHGYTPMRVVPFLIVILGLVYALFSLKKGRWVETARNIGIVALVSAAVTLPLLRFSLQYPELVLERGFSRLGDVANPIPGSGWEIFFSNFWKSATMFFWSNGDIWPHSVPYYPALDTVTAVFYLLGCVLLISRFVSKRKWQDLALLISVPVLMMPSILSLAYPGENPSLNRTSAAFIPVVLIAGLAFESFIRTILQPKDGGRGRWLAGVVAALLLIISINQNFNLVFDKYAKQYQLSAWNTSEIGGVIRQFTDTVGSPETAYVVGYPYWVDTRLVAYNAGFPGMDFAIWPDQFEMTKEKTGAKLFILYPEDLEDLKLLSELYPNGGASYHLSPVEGKNFYVFSVPAEEMTLP